jgi:hypothetical protein
MRLAVPESHPSVNVRRRQARCLLAADETPLTVLAWNCAARARTRAGGFVGPSEELESARLTQLTFEGLTLELKTVDLGSGFDTRMRRALTSTSVLFDSPCHCADQVQEKLIAMFYAD